MGRSASQKAQRAWSENASAPSFESFQRKKPQFDDEFGESDGQHREPHDPTVRNFLPWHEVERKLAARMESGVNSNERVRGCDESDDEAPRDSGIRDGAPKSLRNSFPIPNENEVVDEAALSFRAYTLADLEAQGKPVSIRPTRYSIVAEAQKPVTGTWAALGEVAFAGGNLVHALLSWAKGPSPRPKLKDALSSPWGAFGAEVRRTGKVADWKKLGLALAIGGTTLLVLLFIVLTAAELTDDLKPARASGVQTTTASVKTIGQGQDNANAEPVTPAPIAPTPAPVTNTNGTIEIDDAPAPAVHPPTAKAASKPVVRVPPPPPQVGAGKSGQLKGKYAKSGEVFTP